MFSMRRDNSAATFKADFLLGPDQNFTRGAEEGHCKKGTKEMHINGLGWDGSDNSNLIAPPPPPRQEKSVVTACLDPPCRQMHERASEKKTKKKKKETLFARICFPHASISQVALECTMEPSKFFTPAPDRS